MQRLKTEFFIASRIASSRGGEGGRVMKRVAVATSAVSMAVMILAVAVITGFRSEITSRMCAFSAHVRIVNAASVGSFETEPIRRDTGLERSVAGVRGFESMSAYAVKGGIIKTPQAMCGVLLKGVGPDYDLSFFRNCLVEGALPAIGDSVHRKQLLVSQSVASQLCLSVGDVVQMMFVQQGRPPRRDRFKICGIYSSGLEEMDRLTVITDFPSVRRLCGWGPEQISGYEINTSDFGWLQEFAADVADAAAGFAPEGTVLAVEDVVSSYPNMFDWLRAHNVNAAVIIVVMLVVALFSMISSLLIIILEHTRTIGVLRAIGMRTGAVQRVFLIRSAYILASGIAAGDIFGIALALLQKYTHLVKLDQSGYFLSWVPVVLEPSAIVWLNAGAFVIISALLCIPLTAVSGIRPDKTLRYQ